MEQTTDARGYDAAPEDRPGIPMAADPHLDSGVRGGIPTQQRAGREWHQHRVGLDDVTPVFGTGQPPSGMSGVLRRAAYRIPEHEARHWLMLLMADRMDVLEHRVPELLRGEGWGQLGRQMKANPWMAAGLLVGSGFLLRKAGAADALLRLVTNTPERSPAEERLLAWLNDAYAMEMAQIPVLGNHAKDAKRYDWIREKDLEHLEQTRRQAERVRGCIERHGAKPSAAKAAIGRMSGAMNSLATEPFEDEIAKNFLADFAAENLEIASYRALITAAEAANDAETARVCREILREEQEMAAWLETNLPRAVRAVFANEW